MTLEVGSVSADYSTVTEVAGEPISSEQLDRLCNRYYWAASYCRGRDVIEAGCGSGPGLGFLARVSRSIEAGDYSEVLVSVARRHYRDRIPITAFDAGAMPFADCSRDVVVLLESIYYLPSAASFLSECQRVLRPGGQVLIATANKDLWDFSPSPYSSTYLGTCELNRLFNEHGFTVACFGYMSVAQTSVRQRLLRPIKKLVVSSGLMPRTMRGKRLLKRLVFGQPVPMPAEIDESTASFVEPTPIPSDTPDRQHKVIYCAAQLSG